MIFFLSLLVLTGMAWLLGRLGIPFLRDGRACMRLALTLALMFFGVDHLVTPERYLAMIETWMPWPEKVIAITGLCEIAGGLGLCLPALRRWAGLLLAVYFIAVFPANIHNAVQGLNVEGLPSSQWYYWLRLAFQPLAVWWALYGAGILSWPFGRSMPLHLTPTTTP